MLGGAPAATTANQPVANMDWTRASDACKHLGADAGLPTEAQWEYAARGGSQDAYPFPSDLAELCGYANGAGNERPEWAIRNKECSDPFKDAAPVGRFPPNSLGLYDMHGNLWEWVLDAGGNGAYADRGPDPTAEPLSTGPEWKTRVLRGGSFGDTPLRLRSAIRNWRMQQLQYPIIGFRCVRGAGRQPNP
ncbi:formylglycine-generating enzyme family protein [uncultured Thiodictyon sp.]|uniref:formylglycine-generating enzyme family protein n=1 Tax=uncultured Thiodictyon sp. TaxID=1846217 RepID=UPI0025F63394|nr:formylglycine-generating enzyme family protein [uncultured Thiodictyon sp.]